MRTLEIEERVLLDRIQDKEATENKLKADLAVSEVLVSGLREEILEAETRIQQLETDLSSVKEASTQKEDVVQRLEDELRSIKQVEPFPYMQDVPGDQLNMAVFFWYLVKKNTFPVYATVHVCRLYWTSEF